VLVVGGVPVALLGTGEAGDATGFDQCADKAQVRCGLAGHDAAGRVADLGAVEAEANTTHHLPHVILSEIGVGTTRTAGGTIEALVDAAQHGVAIETSRLWMQRKDLVKGHVSPFVRAAATTLSNYPRRLEHRETSHVDTRDPRTSTKTMIISRPKMVKSKPADRVAVGRFHQPAAPPIIALRFLAR
jgi:hypothetical protein